MFTVNVKVVLVDCSCPLTGVVLPRRVPAFPGEHLFATGKHYIPRRSSNANQSHVRQIQRGQARWCSEYTCTDKDNTGLGMI